MNYEANFNACVDVVNSPLTLQLPESKYSHLLQDWCQTLTIEVPFEKAKLFLERFLPIHLTVDSLEYISRAQAKHVADFRTYQKLTPPEKEGEIVVMSAERGTHSS